MTNKVVEKYLNNFSLINTQGMEVFAREQSKLLSPGLVSMTTDYRGTLTEHGVDGFFHGLAEWSKHFQSNHQSHKEFLDDTPYACPCSRVEPDWARRTGPWQDSKRGG